MATRPSRAKGVFMVRHGSLQDFRFTGSREVRTGDGTADIVTMPRLARYICPAMNPSTIFSRSARVLQACVLSLAVVSAAAPVGAVEQANLDAYVRGDHAAAAKDFGLRATRGDRLAQFNLAMMMFRGEAAGGTAAAMVWLRKSAMQGLSQAQFNLGLLYEHGDGVKANLRRARYWYLQAAQHGDVLARAKAEEMEQRLAPKP
jgi:Sel1 repeat